MDNGAAVEIPQQEEINNLNQGGVNPVNKPPNSPRSSGGSSKSLQIKERRYHNQKAPSKLSGRILGNFNDPIMDLIGVKLIVNYANKGKGANVKPNLTLEDVKPFIKTPQTWRSLLSIYTAVYNPLGLASPHTNKLKFHGTIKKDTRSVDNPGDWDTPVSSILIKQWSVVIKEGTAQGSIWFPPPMSSF